MAGSGVRKLFGNSSDDPDKDSGLLTPNQDLAVKRISTWVDTYGKTSGEALSNLSTFSAYINESRHLPENQENVFSAIQAQDGGARLQNYFKRAMLDPTIAEAQKFYDNAQRKALIAIIIAIVVNTITIALSIWNIRLQKQGLNGRRK